MNRLVFISFLVLVGSIKLLLWLQSPLYALVGYAEFIIFIISLFIWWHQLFKKSRVCWKSLVFILLLFPTLSSFYVLPHFNKKEKANNFTVVNYNVRVFNQYFNLRSDDLHTTTEMIDWVNNVETDVLCLQEFYTSQKSKKNNIVSLLKQKYPRYYFDIITVNGYGSTYGSIVFSKHPIVHHEELKEDKAVNGCYYIDIVKNKDTIRVYSCHLESNKLKESQIEAITTSEGKKTFVGKYLSTAKIRIEQTNQLIDHATDCPYPFIICGDFNDTPVSVVYKLMKHHFTDSFFEAGRGFGTTFHHEKLPNIRIDYQFHSSEFTCNKIRVAKEIPHSDHYPVVGVYSLKKQSD